MTGYAQADLLAQVQASLRPLWRAGDPGYGLDAALGTIGVVSTLWFFVLGRRGQGPSGLVARVGSGFLMVAFGAGYGYAVMSRISVLIGRFDFLLGVWLGLR